MYLCNVYDCSRNKLGSLEHAENLFLCSSLFSQYWFKQGIKPTNTSNQIYLANTKTFELYLYYRIVFEMSNQKKNKFQFQLLWRNEDTFVYISPININSSLCQMCRKINFFLNFRQFRFYFAKNLVKYNESHILFTLGGCHFAADGDENKKHYSFYLCLKLIRIALDMYIHSFQRTFQA